MKFFYALIVVFFVSLNLFAQNQKDLFLKALDKPNISVQEKVDLYVKLAQTYSYSDSLHTILYARKAVTLAQRIHYIKGKVEAIYAIASLNLTLGNYLEAEKLLRSAIKISRKSNSLKCQGRCLNGLGVLYDFQGNYNLALKYYLESLAIFKKLKDKKGISNTYSNIGVVYDLQGNYNRALDYHFRSLKIKKKLQDSKGLSISYNNIGAIYKTRNNHNKALEYFLKSLKLKKRCGDKKGMSATYNNIGDIYIIKKYYSKALNYFFKSLKIAESIGNKRSISHTYAHIGAIYEEQNQYPKSLGYFKRALEISQNIGDKEGTSVFLYALGRICRKQKQFMFAEKYLKEGLLHTRATGLLAEKRDITSELALVEEGLGNYQKAYEYQVLLKQIEDSLQNEKQSQKIARIEMEYEFKQEKDSLQNLNEKERIKFEQATEKRNLTQTATWIVVGLLALLLLVLFLFFRSKTRSNQSLTEKSKDLELANEKLQSTNKELQNSVNIIFEANQKNKEMNKQLDANNKVLKMAYEKNKEMNKQLDINNKVIEKAYNRNQKITNELKDTLNIVKQQKEEILDSIQYAQRIQKAILPLPTYFQTLLPKHFIFDKPQNIVSGDFYFLTQHKNKTILAVADCTGHGIPGAFMSLIGYNVLVDIAINRKIKEANLILEQLHVGIRFLLRQKETKNNDGMDIALAVIDKESKTLEFAGAKNPIVYIQNNELKVIKGDKMPIGGEQREVKRVFTSHQINISEPTTFYLFSDGIQDQFGGKDNKKFTPKRLRNLLLDNHQKPMNEQKEILAQTIENWQKEGKEEQIDDMLLIGVKI